jgi:hypothetical protein
MKSYVERIWKVQPNKKLWMNLRSATYSEYYCCNTLYEYFSKF